MIFCGFGAMAMTACMTIPSSGSSSMSGSFFGTGAPPTSFSSSSGYSSNGSSSSYGSGGYAASSGYGSSGTASQPAPSTSGSGDPSEGGAVPPGYSNNTRQSNALTSYLQSHRLPLVGGQVLTDSSGDKQVILYGFVATDFGKQDAADKARRYLHDANVPVVNRIAVRPELAAGSGSATPPAGSASGATGSENSNLGGVQSYEDQAQQAQQQQQYMQQNQAAASSLTAIIPLIGMMGMMGMGSGGVGIGGGGIGMGSPYGYPPSYGYPYGSYGSPYGTPYRPYAPSYGYPGAFP